MNNKKYLGFFLFFILFSSTAFAEVNIFDTQPSRTLCLSNTTSQHMWNYTNETNPTVWQYTLKNISCANNCSTTLSDCRADEFNQLTAVMIILIATFAICVFGMWIGRITPMLDFPIYAVMMVFLAFMGGVLDIFIARYQTMMLAFFLIPLGFFFLSLYLGINTGSLRKSMRREDKRATGR